MAAAAEFPICIWKCMNLLFSFLCYLEREQPQKLTGKGHILRSLQALNRMPEHSFCMPPQLTGCCIRHIPMQSGHLPSRDALVFLIGISLFPTPEKHQSRSKSRAACGAWGREGCQMVLCVAYKRLCLNCLTASEHTTHCNSLPGSSKQGNKAEAFMVQVIVNAKTFPVLCIYCILLLKFKSHILSTLKATSELHICVTESVSVLENTLDYFQAILFPIFSPWFSLVLKKGDRRIILSWTNRSDRVWAISEP